MLQFLAPHVQRLRRPTSYLRPPIPPIAASDNPASLAYLAPELIRNIVDSIELDELILDPASQSWIENPARELIPYRDLFACSLVSSAFNAPAVEGLYRRLVIDVSKNPTLLELEARGTNWRGEFQRLSTLNPGLSEDVIDSMFFLPAGSASLVATLENQRTLAALVREVEVIYGPRPADVRAITATSALVAKVLAACPNVECVQVVNRISENLTPLESSAILSVLASRSNSSLHRFSLNDFDFRGEGGAVAKALVAAMPGLTKLDLLESVWGEERTLDTTPSAFHLETLALSMWATTLEAFVALTGSSKTSLSTLNWKGPSGRKDIGPYMNLLITHQIPLLDLTSFPNLRHLTLYIPLHESSAGLVEPAKNIIRPLHVDHLVIRAPSDISPLLYVDPLSYLPSTLITLELPCFDGAVRVLAKQLSAQEPKARLETISLARRSDARPLSNLEKGVALFIGILFGRLHVWLDGVEVHWDLEKLNALKEGVEDALAAMHQLQLAL